MINDLTRQGREAYFVFLVAWHSYGIEADAIIGSRKFYVECFTYCTCLLSSFNTTRKHFFGSSQRVSVPSNCVFYFGTGILWFVSCFLKNTFAIDTLLLLSQLAVKDCL